MSDKSLSDPLTEEEEEELESWISGLGENNSPPRFAMRTVRIDLECGGVIHIQARLPNPKDVTEEMSEKLARMMQSA